VASNVCTRRLCIKSILQHHKGPVNQYFHILRNGDGVKFLFFRSNFHTSSCYCFCFAYVAVALKSCMKFALASRYMSLVQVLSRLLRSKNANDLQAANRLIKNIVRQVCRSLL